MTNTTSLKIRLTAAVLISLLIALYSCTKEVGVIPVIPPPPPGFCDTISYAEDIAPLVTAKCISCHVDATSAGKRGLGSYAQMKEVADNGLLHGVISVGTPQYRWMPDGTTGLPEDEKKIIECWINNGTKP